MVRRGPFRWGLALAVVLVAQYSQANEAVCRSGCRGEPHNFKYAQDTTYKYNYEGKIEITLSSAEGQTSSTDVKATVLLTQLADCNQLLRLQNVQILGPNGKKYGHPPDIEKPIRINFHDGHIEDSICTESGDSQNSLNIKRAIASLFQANPKSAHETDVFGLCPTEYAQHSEDSKVMVIQKSRNLNKCAYREHIRQDFFNTVFNLNSEIKSSPILNGEYSANFKIKDGVLQQANAVENYLYVPFSVGKNGAKAQVTSKLHLTGTSKETPKHQCSKPRSIIFENPHPVTAPSSNVNMILEAVKDVVKTIDIVVGDQTAKEFITLIKTIRAGKTEDLLAVYNQVKSGAGFNNKVTAKKVFLDALLQAATSEAAEVAITLLKSNEFNDIEKKLVYAGLSFVRHSSESLINTAASLLGQNNLPYEVYLGIGNIARRYCQQHSCEKNDVVNKLTQKLIQKLGDNKAANKQEESQMVYVLKSLANFGHLSDAVVQKLVSIAQDKQAPTRLRVVSLESYLADPCKDKLRNSALSILQDIQQDSEIRIKAYLAAAQCPNAKVGTTVKALLEKELSYQVGGFIVSHIRSLKASANPDKDLAKQFLSFTVPKKFPIDLRKYSYNGEFSYAVDSLGLAASSEANIIYSQDSFLPRSTSLNLTAEVFGHTFNFLEIQTRQENLDRLVEHYFGPKGVLRTSSLGELMKDNEKVAVNTYRYLNEKLSSVLRSRRDVSKAEIDSIGKSVQIKENVLNKDLDLDISVKSFGSEILFSNLNMYQEGLKPEAIIDKIIDCFSEGLDKLKNFKESLRSNLLLLDIELDYPTGLGFPLRLAAEGTANIQIETEGNIDVRSILKNRDGLLKLKVIPSANVEVTGRLTLDALVVESGLKVISTLYTSTGGDLSVDLSDKGFDVKFGLPIQEQKLLAANHEIVFHTREQAGEEKNTPLKFAQQKDFSICIDQLSPFIGLGFCIDLNGPNLAGKQTPILPFPLAGDAKLTITIENEDISFYHVKGHFTKPIRHVELEIAAIGKNNQKKTEFTLNAEISPEKYLKLVLNSPLKTAYAEARITDNANEKSAMAKFGYDQTEFYGKIGILISGSPGKFIYKPILEYKVPEGIQMLPVRIEGQLIAEETSNGRKYTFDKARLVLPNGQAVDLKGSFGAEGDTFSTDLDLSSGKAAATVKARVMYQPEVARWNAEFTNTINPAANFVVKGELLQPQGLYETSLTVIHGADQASKTNKLSLFYKVENKWGGPGNYSYGVESKISYPLVGVNAEYEFKINPKKIEYDIDLEYNEIKLGSELELELNKHQAGDFDIEFSLYGLDNKIKIKSEREVQKETSKIKNELEINGKKLEVNGLIKHQLKSGNVDIGADLTIIIPTHPTPFKVDSGLKYNPNDYDAHHKVISGSNVIVDSFVKGNRQGDINGSFKVNIKSYLVVNGQIKAGKGVGTADLLIDAQKVKQQIKLDSSFKIQYPSVYDIDLTIYPSFDKDKNQQIKISTHNLVDQRNLNSKNILNLLGKKTELNVVSKRNGNDQKGNLEGEIELTLPNDWYMIGKLISNREYKNELFNGDGIISLEYRKNKNSSGRKLSVKANYKDTNPQDGLYNVKYDFAVDDTNGKYLGGDVAFRREKQGEEWVVRMGGSIHGALIKESMRSDMKAVYSKHSADVEVIASYGDDLTMRGGVKYNTPGEGHPCTGETFLRLTTPNKMLNKLDLQFSGSVLRPTSKSDRLEIKGAGQIFADDDGSVADPIIDLKGDGLVRASDKDGALEGNFKYGKQGPVAASAGYSVEETGKQKNINGNAKLSYGNSKNYKLGGSLSRKDDHQYKLEIDLETPFEHYHKNQFTVQTKSSPDSKHITSNVQATSDDKKISLDTELQLSDLSPLVDLKLKMNDKISRLYFKGNRINDREFNGEVKLNSDLNDFLFEGDWDAKIENVQEFFVKGNINSPPLKINKVGLELQSKPGKGDRKIQILIKSAGKNLLTGSTNYHSKEDGGKFIIEGSGTFKLKEESNTGKFKFTNQRLSGEKNNEEGVDISLDISLGKRTFDSEIKLTNKQGRFLVSYCDKPKECSRVDVNSKVKHNDIKSYDQVLDVIIDLRKLGVPHDFSLKAKTQRNEQSFDQNVDVHFNNGASKYQYNLYIHPTKAGVSLSSPKRIIALEGVVQIPKDVRQGGKFTGAINFYLDKKNTPNKKISIEGVLDFDKKYTIDGKLKLNHPGIDRTLSIVFTAASDATSPVVRKISFNGELDVFAQPKQKVEIIYSAESRINEESYDISNTLNAKSSGLGIDLHYRHEAKFNKNQWAGNYLNKLEYHLSGNSYIHEISLQGNKQELNTLIKLYNTDILKTTNKLAFSKDQQTIDSEISSYDNNPIVTHLDIKNLNTLLFTIGHKNTPKNKIQFNAGLIPTQIADIRSDHITPAGKVNLFLATVHLDNANFLKPEYNVNAKEIETLFLKIRDAFFKHIEGLNNKGREWLEIDIKEGSKLNKNLMSSLPNMQPIRQYYQSELDKIKQEVMHDQSVKEFVELFQNTFGVLFNAIIEVTDSAVKAIIEVAQAISTAIFDVAGTIEKELGPPLKQLINMFANIGSEISKSVIEIVSTYLALMSELCEKYQPQFKEVAAIFSEVGQDIARFIQNAYLQSVEIVVGFTNKIYDELKALPIYEELQARYEEFLKEIEPTRDGIIEGVKEISATIKDMVPEDFIGKPEIVEIIDLTISYLEKKLKMEPVNDAAILQKILVNELTLVKKLLGTLSTPSYEPPRGDIPMTLDFLKKLPKLVSVKFSPLNYILKEDPSEALVTLALSFINNPRRWIPPFPLYAILVQGQYIFTFDGKLVHFPGNCKYVLARDGVNGNFTLVGQYQNGYLNSITLADKHDIITLKKGGQVLLNNAASELPTRKPDIAAYRSYEMVNLVSTSGITVSCQPDLEGCSVSISGFYHGQVRGLLGNGNNEPFDDLTAANGKIVSNEGEFGDSYKVGNCQPVNVPKHGSAPSSAKCNKLFGWDSTLSLCYPFVKTDNFKAACAQGEAAKVKNIELIVARAYVAACWEHNIPAIVPSELLKCTNADKTHGVGDSFNVKLPGKSADIVLIVDTLKENEQIYKEFFQPMVLELVKTLQSKGVSDVQFHLITYGGDNKWPSHVTVGGKLTFKGKAPNLKFSSEKKENLIAESLPKPWGGYLLLFEDILYDMELAVGLDLRARTFTEAYFYPFRSNALKSIIVVNSKPCEVGKLVVLQQLRTLIFKNDQISLNLISPLQQLTLKDNKKTKDVIGFNDNHIFTVSQAKKKPEGSAELYKDLDYNDYCIDFTIKNRGNVFGTENFLSAKADVKKQFVHVAAYNIANELINVDQGLECTCRQINPYHAYNVCRETFTKEK